MAILKMKAYGDFEVPYEINITVGEKQKIQGICRILNKFCKELPGSAQDIKLSHYLNNDETANKLAYQLMDKGYISPQKALDFIGKLIDICKHNYVYVGEYVFSYENVFDI